MSALDEARLRANGDGDARRGQHRQVERAVAERGVKRAIADAQAEGADLSGGLRDGAIDVGEHRVPFPSGVGGDDVIDGDSGDGRGGVDDGARRGAHEEDLDAGVGDDGQDRAELGVKARGDAALQDDVARERVDARARPPRERAGDQLEEALFGEGAVFEGAVKRARDLDGRAARAQAVRGRLARKGLGGDGLEGAGVEQREEQIVADVATPQGAVSVGRDDAPRLGARLGEDPLGDSLGWLGAHEGSVTYRSTPWSRSLTWAPACSTVRRVGAHSLTAAPALTERALVMRTYRIWGSVGILLGLSAPFTSAGVAFAQGPAKPGPVQPAAPPVPSGGAPSTAPPMPPDYVPASTAIVPVPNDLLKASEGGLTAEQTAKRAAQTSYQAKAADENLRGAAARVDAAWLAFLPRLSGTASYTRLSNFTPPSFGSGSLVATTAPSGTFLNANSPLIAEAFVIPLVLNQWLFQARVVVPISDYFFKINQNYESATRSQDAYRYDAITQRAISWANGKIAYYTWLRARGGIVVAVEALNDQRVHLKDAQNQFADAAHKAVEVQKAGKYPVLSAFGDGIEGNPNSRRFPATQDWFGTWDVGAQLTWSPNDLLTANANVVDFETRAAAIEAQRGVTRDGIDVEVLQNYQGVREADFAIDSSKREVASATEAYRVARELFNNGRGTSTTLTDAESDLTRSRLDLLNAYADARIARVRLDHSLGRDTRQFAGGQ